jgi:hypothetical protein
MKNLSTFRNVYCELINQHSTLFKLMKSHVKTCTQIGFSKCAWESHNMKNESPKSHLEE